MRRKPCPYKVLAVLMAAKDISIEDLSKMTGIGYKTMCRKLNGDSKICVTEAISIVSAIDKSLTVEDVFTYVA